MVFILIGVVLLVLSVNQIHKKRTRKIKKKKINFKRRFERRE